jgi:hypothetical protein
MDYVDIFNNSQNFLLESAQIFIQIILVVSGYKIFTINVFENLFEQHKKKSQHTGRVPSPFSRFPSSIIDRKQINKNYNSFQTSRLNTRYNWNIVESGVGKHHKPQESPWLSVGVIFIDISGNLYYLQQIFNNTDKS